MSGRLIIGDARTALRELEAGSVQCCVTSPPYWRQRDYGHPDQIGQEDTPSEYVASIVAVMREVRRVLRPDGTLWLNLGDSHVGARGGGQGKNSAFGTRAAARSGARVQNRTKKVEGLANKCLVGIPWRVAFGLMDDGWILRMDHIWEKPNPTPESMKDRCTKAHEYVFHLSKGPRYYHDADAIAEPVVGDFRPGAATTVKGDGSDTANRLAETRGARNASVATTRNARTIWRITPRPYKGAHFAAMPPELAARCIMAGSRFGDTVLDPFGGSGTVGEECSVLGRRWIAVELQPDYQPLIEERTRQMGLVPVEDAHG